MSFAAHFFVHLVGILYPEDICICELIMMIFFVL